MPTSLNMWWLWVLGLKVQKAEVLPALVEYLVCGHRDF